MDKAESVQGLTESQLLELIPGRDKQYPHVIRGIGDDCAVIGFDQKDDSCMLLTQDSLISGRHFIFEQDDPYYVGWKALARSVSDIAAMGGDPQSSLVSYGIPASTPVTWLKRVFEGLHDCATKYCCPIIGGDMASTSNELFFSTTCIGKVSRNKMLLRSGAVAGDLLCVTGTLGGSIAGKHLCFKPRVEHAKWLVDHVTVSAMIDLSDGVAKDLFHIAESSNVGFQIDHESIPVSAHIEQQYGDDHDTAVSHALYDGEDYELLFTVSATQETLQQLCDSFYSQFDVPCTVIGRCVGDISGIELWKQGKKYTTINPGGFEHFR